MTFAKKQHVLVPGQCPIKWSEEDKYISYGVYHRGVVVDYDDDTDILTYRASGMSFFGFAPQLKIKSDGVLRSVPESDRGFRVGDKIPYTKWDFGKSKIHFKKIIGVFEGNNVIYDIPYLEWTLEILIDTDKDIHWHSIKGYSHGGNGRCVGGGHVMQKIWTLKTGKYEGKPMKYYPLKGGSAYPVTGIGLIPKRKLQKIGDVE